MYKKTSTKYYKSIMLITLVLNGNAKFLKTLIEIIFGIKTL